LGLTRIGIANVFGPAVVTVKANFTFLPFLPFF